MDSHKFGTFAGVFTPSVLTILGVILFMRAGFVVGQAGVFSALLILVIAKIITSLTSLSVSAISTNMEVRGGGAYFLISRVLGPEFGGAIGLALFFAQALSVPFYILGFVEALVGSNPNLSDYFLWITLGSAAVLYGIAYVGAQWAIKAQYVIMTLLGLSLLAVFGGLISIFDINLLWQNWGSAYTAIDPANPAAGNYQFWGIFAIYFPAVTGILAGVNMSGDLKDANRSIPRGTLMALGLTFLVYFLLIIISGGALTRETMIADAYGSLRNNALFGMGFLVAGGVYAASLSSALGSYLGAPRILQAVARDRILGFIQPFSKGTLKGDEPRRALLLTGGITLLVLLWAGNESGGASLNVVASIITMFFLYTYGMINVAAFIEAFGKNPSFRPRFRFFHWSTALLASLSCLGVAFLIDAFAAVAAAVILAGLLWYIQRKNLSATFGDARRGFVYTRVRRNLLRLNDMEEDSKNWRPTILAFLGNPHNREALANYAVWMESGRGIVLLANVMPAGNLEQNARRRDMAENQIKEFCRQKNIQAFPVIATGDNLLNTTAHLIQSVSIGSIRPNICLYGFSQSSDKVKDLMDRVRVGCAHGLNQVLVALPSSKKEIVRPSRQQKQFIDIWWRGQENGKLMIILGHLMGRNWEWSNSELRIIRVVEDEVGLEPARSALKALVEEARVEASVIALVKDRPFQEILYHQSGFSDCVFLGFDIPHSGEEEQWYANYAQLLKNMPPTLLVHARTEEDVLT